MFYFKKLHFKLSEYVCFVYVPNVTYNTAVSSDMLIYNLYRWNSWESMCFTKLYILKGQIL